MFKFRRPSESALSPQIDPMVEFVPIADHWRQSARLQAQGRYDYPVISISLPTFLLSPEGQLWCGVAVYLPAYQGKDPRFLILVAQQEVWEDPVFVEYGEASSGVEQVEKLTKTVQRLKADGYSTPAPLITYKGPTYDARGSLVHPPGTIGERD